MDESPGPVIHAHRRPATTLRDPRGAAAAVVRHAQATGYAKPLFVLADEARPGADGRQSVQTWWIAPEPRPPAYACGKIIVTSRYGAAVERCGGGAALLVGLCMQKGLDPRAMDSLPARRRNPEWAMTAKPRWIWETFLPEMAAGHIDPLAAKAEDFGACPLTVVVETRDPSGRDGAETVLFSWSGGKLQPVVAPHRRTRAYVRDVSSADTLAALAQRLRHTPELLGQWIDLAVGIQLWMDASDPDTPLWDESRIWASACRPWSMWLR